jgi:hypothetical protein
MCTFAFTLLGWVIFLLSMAHFPAPFSGNFVFDFKLPRVRLAMQTEIFEITHATAESRLARFVCICTKQK